MNPVLKIIIAVVGTFLVVFATLGLYIYIFFDPNDYKQQITAWVKDNTGRELQIHGDIELSLFPWLGVSLGEMTLSNHEGFGPEPFARLEGADLSARLLPLLMNQEVETEVISLKGLTLHLGVDESGRTNWEDLLAAGNGTAPAGASRSDADSAEQINRVLAAAAIGGVQVSDSRVVWQDRRNDTRITVNGLELHTGALRPRRPFDVGLQFGLAVQPHNIAGQVKLSGQGVLEPMTGQYTLEDTRVTLHATGAGMPVTPLDVRLRTQTLFDVPSQTLTFSELVAQGLDAEVTGELKVRQVMDVPELMGSLLVSGFDTRKFINRFTAEPVMTADSSVLGPATANIDFNANSHHIDIRHVHAGFDSTIVNGAAEISELDNPLIQFRLFFDDIDVDRYLPPATRTAATPGAAAAAGSGALPVETLRDLRMDGELNFGRLKIAGLRTREAAFAVQARDGELTVRPEASLYEGSYRGNIRLDVQGEVPRLSVDESLDGVQLSPLLNDLIDNSLVTGTGSVRARLSMRPDSTAEIRRTLNGSVSFNLSDGAIRGINVAQLIREAKARLEGKRLGALSGPLKTDYTQINGTLNATDGVLRNDDLIARTSFLRIGGRGSVNLVADDIDYVIDVTIVNTPIGQGGVELHELKGVTIPIRVTGSLADPSFQPDVEGLAKERLKQEIDKRLKGQGGEAEKQIEELKGKVKEQLDKLF